MTKYLTTVKQRGNIFLPIEDLKFPKLKQPNLKILYLSHVETIFLYNYNTDILELRRIY